MSSNIPGNVGKASRNGRKILTSLRFCGRRQILPERTMETLICNDTIEYIMKTIDFPGKVKHIRPTTEKRYNSIRKELNDKLDVVK